MEKQKLEPQEMQITGQQYLVLKALLKAASRGPDRAELRCVFYDQARDQFVATDGHVLRIEKLAWLEGEPPEYSFLLAPVDLMLTANQIKLRYGNEQKTSDLEEIQVTIIYEPRPEPDAYLNYAAVMPGDGKRFPLEWISLSPDLLASLKRTFYEVPRALIFQFSGELGGVTIYTKAGDRRNLAGLLMPMRVLGEKPEPLFEVVSKVTGEVAPAEAIPA